MTVGEYLWGAILLVAVLAGALFTAIVLVRRRCLELEGAPLIVASCLLAITAVIAIHLAPLALGLLSRGTVLGATAILATAALAVPARTLATERDEPPPEHEAAVSRALALAGAAALAGCVLAATLRDAATPLPDVDMLSFHIPVVADWIQTGSAWQITQLIPGQAQGNYPQHGDVLILASVLPWHSDFLVRLVQLPLLAVAATALYATGREFGATRSSALLIALAAAAMPAVARTSVVQAMPDTLLVAGFAAAVLFLLRHHRTGRSHELVLAGVGLGLAFGTKWYGVSSAAVVIAVWTGLRLLAAGRRRPGLVSALLDASILTAVVLAVGGFWLLRNLVESSNPVFPVEVSLFGVVLFDAPRDAIREIVGFSLADYLGDAEVWREYLLPAFRAAFGLPGAAIVLGAIVTTVVALTRPAVRRERRSRPVPALAAAAALTALVYAVTPYTALGYEGAPIAAEVNARYAVPALVGAAAILGWGLARVHRRWLVGAHPLLLVAVLDGLRRTFDISIAAAALGTVAAAAALALVAIARAQSLPQRIRLGITAAGVLGTLAAGLALERSFADGRYAGEDPVFDSILEHAPSSRTVALAGLWTNDGTTPILVSYGPRLDNRVRYIGPIADGMLGRYRTRDGFTTALARARPDLLVVGRSREVVPRARSRQPLPDERPVTEETWVRSAGWALAARSDRLALYVRRRTLNRLAG